MRNNFMTDIEAKSYDEAIQQAWTKILGKTPGESPLLSLSVKYGGAGITCAADRYNVALWTAWQGAMDTVLQTTGLGTIDNFCTQCPTLSDSLGVVQQHVSSSTGLNGIGLATLGVALRRNAKQKQLVDRIHKKVYEEQLHGAMPIMKALYRSYATPGAAAFLELPEHMEYVMEDKAFVTSVFRRLL